MRSLFSPLRGRMVAIGIIAACSFAPSLVLPAHADAMATQQTKQITVKGIVRDNLDVLIGATVVEKGNTANGCVTNMNGEFTLTVPVGAQLEISYIGYVTQTVAVQDGKTQINVTLKDDSQALAEVVVVGYGTQKKVNLTGSVASVSTDEIKDRVQTDVLSAVQGTVPGVTIISRPGGTPSINFRGRGNLGNSEPLYVIDGAIADAAFFSNLDPNSIESISFLKDAASSAIYGSRAAYGVVLVTTKGGSKERMNISYNGYVSLDQPTYLMEFVNSADYARLYNEALKNANPNAPDFYTQEEIGWLADGSRPYEYPNTQWDELVLDKNVLTTKHSLNFSGGSERIRYFAGLGYTYRDNFIPNRNRNRYNMNINVDSDLNDWLTMKMGVKYIQDQNDVDSGTPYLPYFSVVPSTYVARQENGEWGSIAAGRPAAGDMMVRNPLRPLSFGDWSKTKNEFTMYNVGIDIKPVKGLVLSASGIMKAREYKYKGFTATRPDIIGLDGSPISGTGNDINSMSMDWRSYRTMLYTATAKYDWEKNDHAVNVLVGTSYEHYKYDALGASRQGFPNDLLIDLNAGSQSGESYGNSGGVSENKMLSYFARVNYALKGRYLFEANVRADASSRFHKDHRWGVFPSFSAGWRISEEAFMEDIEWIDNLKLRASYGMLGNINNVGDYDYFAVYNSDGSIYNYNGTVVPGVYEGRVPNESLGWETVALTNVGVDFEVLNGKLSIGADYYIKKTSDILLAYPVPVETGAGSISQNLGKVKNQGFEMSITHRNRINDFSYTISGNFSTNKNEITDLGGMDQLAPEGAGGGVQWIKRVGESIGAFYGLKSDGLYTQEEIDAGHYYSYSGIVPQAGDIKYVPQRGQEYGQDITADDQVIIGCDVPKFTYGLNLNLTYKNFEFSLFGQGVLGTKVGFGEYSIHPFFHGYDNPRKFHMNRWTVDNPNPNAIYPRLYDGTNGHAVYNRAFSDFFLYDSDYFRIKTLSLGYALPNDLVKGWGLQGLKVFLTGENLFTIRADKKLKDFDPESGSGYLGNIGTKSFALGVNLSF